MKLEQYYNDKKGRNGISTHRGDSTSARLTCLIEKPTEAFQLRIQSKSAFLKSLNYPSQEDIKQISTGLFAKKNSFSKYYFRSNGFARLPMVRSEFIACHLASGDELLDFSIPDETLGSVSLTAGSDGSLWLAEIQLNNNIGLELHESIVTKILSHDKGLEPYYEKSYFVEELYSFKEGRSSSDSMLHALSTVSREDLFENYYVLEVDITTSSEPNYRKHESNWVFEIEGLNFTS